MGLKEDFAKWIQCYEDGRYPGDWLPDEERKCIGCAIARGYREEDEKKRKNLHRLVESSVVVETSFCTKIP